MSGPNPQESAAALGHLNMLSAARAAAGRSLTEDDLAKLDELPGGGRCSHCGGIHARSCPRVKRMEFHPNGIVAAVEFWPHDRVNWEGVLFEDQADSAPGLTADDWRDLLIDVKFVLDLFEPRKGYPVSIPNGLARHPAREYVEQAIARIRLVLGLAMADSPAHEPGASIAGHVGCAGYEPGSGKSCPCECHNPPLRGTIRA